MSKETERKMYELGKEYGEFQSGVSWFVVGIIVGCAIGYFLSLLI